MKALKALSALVVLSILTSCSHNPAVFTVGKRTNIGFDPGQLAANISWTNGLNVMDIPRENSSWELEINDETGLQFDPGTNTITGVSKITRKTGIQITGYLVELAQHSPEAALEYIKHAAELQKTDGVKLSPHLVTLPLSQSNGIGISKLTLKTLKQRAEAEDNPITEVPEGLEMDLADWKLLVEAYKDCPGCLALSVEEAKALEELTGISYPYFAYITEEE